jgi:hypothetical protein
MNGNKEQQRNSAVEDDGGCPERTAVKEQQLCGNKEGLLDVATEEQQMPNF